LTRYLIDTNLLVLLILGGSDKRLVGNHKRLKNFDLADYEELEKILSNATGFVTLSYILTETSNLIEIGSKASAETARLFENFVHQADELCASSEDIIDQHYFRRLGLTDAAIIHLARNQVHVLTVDHALCGILLDIGVKATNLRHRTRFP
jgi:rRNA-processing protein FCF1